MHRTLFGIVLLLLTATSVASKLYSPAQLNQLIDSRSYPQLGDVSREESKSVAWDECLARIQAISGAVGADYPVETTVDTASIRTVKMWTNAGLLTATCSKPDNELTITQATYL